MPLDRRKIPDGVEVFEINGLLFFGAAYKFEESILAITNRPQALIIRLRNLLSIDATGLKVLEQVYQNCHRQGITLILSGVQSQPMGGLIRSGLAETLGKENLLPHFDAALERATQIVENALASK